MKFDEALLKLNWSELYLEGSKASNPFEHEQQQQPQQLDVKMFSFIIKSFIVKKKCFNLRI